MKVIDRVLHFFFGAFLGIVFFGTLVLCAMPHLEKTDRKQEEKEVLAAVVKVVDDVQKEETQKTICIGEFVLTAYCGESHHHICNDGTSETTATGTTPKAGRTIAVDPNVIPYGTVVLIEGREYVAEDCGGAIKGNRIDVFFESHKEALEFGKQKAIVEVVVK